MASSCADEVQVRYWEKSPKEWHGGIGTGCPWKAVPESVQGTQMWSVGMVGVGWGWTSSS